MPRLVHKATLDKMKAGSVPDMAASSGGNVEGTVSGKSVLTDNGVHIIGAANIPADLQLNLLIYMPIIYELYHYPI